MSDEEEYEGVCGTELYINTEEEGKVAVTLKVSDVVVGNSTRDEHTFMLAAKLFRHLFKEHLSPHQLDEANFHVIAEIPRKLLRKEWEVFLEKSGLGGAKFKLSSDPVENELSKYIPQVVVKDEEE